ncbi:MAG: hypothetical protein AB7O69_12590 [Burkholderiales bacterium]
MPSLFAALLFAAALAPLPVLAAQPSPASNPASPEAPVRQSTYESVFAGYQSYKDEKPASWREVNDEVGRVGGQAGIFGGAGHAGHGSAKPSTNSPPAASKPQQVPQPMHGKGHQGMMK